MNFRLLPREEKFYTDFQALASELKRGARLLEEMVAPDRPVWAPAIEINRLEHEADRIHQQAVTKLFDDERDPIVVMKWKEALDFLEDATDRCEDVANVLEGVMVKHG